MAQINNGLFNNYTKKPRSLTEYTAFRGVTDFSQIGQFNQYEGGYQFISVIKMPKFITMLGQQNQMIEKVANSFKHAVEYEFRGLSGIPDLQSDTLELTDGINNVRMINKVTRDTAITVSMPYFEKSGGLFTKFSEYYLTGIKDPNSQAKTYHGLIKNGLLNDGLENEVFTLLYYVTDNTMLHLERAVLLANAQLTKAEHSMYDGNRSDIGSNKEINLEFNCYPIFGYEVEKAAYTLLQDITGVKVTSNNAGVLSHSVVNTKNVAALDSADYRYGILDSNSPDAIDTLVAAVNRAGEK